MAKVTLKGNEIHTNGELPKVGTEAPDFKGVKSDLSELSLSDLKGKKVVIMFSELGYKCMCGLGKTLQ